MIEFKIMTDLNLQRRKKRESVQKVPTNIQHSKKVTRNALGFIICYFSNIFYSHVKSFLSVKE